MLKSPISFFDKRDFNIILISYMLLKRITIPLSLVIFFIVSCNKENIENTTFSNGPAEFPALSNNNSSILLTHSTKFNGKNITTYSAEYDTSKKHARWVAFKFFDLTAEVNVNRSPDDSFAADPSLNANYQRIRSDFGAKGFDRGHLCASADRLYSQEANLQTFYYTNMSPQKNSFNTGVWQSLENLTRAWGRSNTLRDTLYVVKGGTIDKEEQIWKYIDNDRSKPVPKYYFMAFLNKKGDKYKGIAFWLDQTITYPTNVKLANYAISINQLEELTGIDFFVNLNDNLEKAIEQQLQLDAWPSLQ